MHPADRLLHACAERDTVVVLGLDPRLDLLPRTVVDAAVARHGDSKTAVAQAMAVFADTIMSAAAPFICAVKPQFACYERYGSAGVAALEQTVARARELGLPVIGDGKRGDLGGSAQAYADAYLGRVALPSGDVAGLAVDWLTVNPLMGGDALAPLLDSARQHQRGLFILVKTSNAGSGEVQDLRLEGGEMVSERLGQLVQRWGEHDIGAEGYSSVGAVVGATHPREAVLLRQLMPRTLFLAPGYGAQGGTAASVMSCFDRRGHGAVVNASRALAFAFREPTLSDRFGEAGYAEATAFAAQTMRDELATALRKHRAAHLGPLTDGGSRA